MPRRRLVGADRQEDDRRRLHGHDGRAHSRRPARRRPFAAHAGRRVRAGHAPDAQAAVGTLDELPELVSRIDGGPAVLIIGDVVAHSAPWRESKLNEVISKLLETAA